MGEHIHHGYFLAPDDAKEKAQVRLIELLLEHPELRPGNAVLDVFCGIGGTARYLAQNRACRFVGLIISGRQVRMARKLTAEEADGGAGGGGEQDAEVNPDGVGLGGGSVRFVELDVEEMGSALGGALGDDGFDCVWISEAMSHLPNMELFSGTRPCC